MAIFKKNQEVDPKVLDDTQSSYELNRPKIETNPDIAKADFVEIVKTTDSMNFLMDSNKGSQQNEELMRLTRESIAQNYELARRRINSTYQEIIDSGAYVGISFIAVQLALINFDKEWNVEKIKEVITTFSEEIFATLITKVGVEISDELFFETVVYIDKILFASSVSPKFVSTLKSITWSKLFDRLVKDNKLTLANREIVENFVYALDENVKRGYYVQLGEFIVSRVSFDSRNTILLYSHETLVRANHDFRSYQQLQQQKVTNVSDDIASMQETLRKINQTQEEKERVKKSSPLPNKDFKPRDDKGKKAPPSKTAKVEVKGDDKEDQMQKTLEFDAKLMQKESQIPTRTLDLSEKEIQNKLMQDEMNKTLISEVALDSPKEPKPKKTSHKNIKNKRKKPSRF